MLELTDQLGQGNVRDIKNQHAGSAPAAIGKVSLDIGWPVKPCPYDDILCVLALKKGLALSRFQTGEPLLLPPPSAHLHGIFGVDDVNDAVNHAGKPLACRREMDIAPARIEKPVSHARRVPRLTNETGTWGFPGPL